MNIDTTTVLQYSGVTDEMINETSKSLVNKSYVDRCFYPFYSPVVLDIPTNEVFNITPSILKSYWVIKDFGDNSGVLNIDLTDTDMSLLTFEVMVIKTDSDTGSLTFGSNIKWLEGDVPSIADTGYVYFLVFRTMKINSVWTIVGNYQGRVGINQ